MTLIPSVFSPQRECSPKWHNFLFFTQNQPSEIVYLAYRAASAKLNKKRYIYDMKKHVQPTIHAEPAKLGIEPCARRRDFRFSGASMDSINLTGATNSWQYLKLLELLETVDNNRN